MEESISKQFITEIPVDDNEEVEATTERTSIEEVTVPEENVVEENFLEHDDTKQVCKHLFLMSSSITCFNFSKENCSHFWNE